MLLGLTIRDVVLIERLELAWQPGLCVLTGETGAGKSILLDALGLALGARGDSALVRHGASQAVVSAEFGLAADHPVRRLLVEQGLESFGEDAIVLRRVLTAEGRSRAFVNDEPVGVGMLRQIGDTLVEIQGQFDQRGLLDPATHRGLLDAFGGHGAEVEALRGAFKQWRAAVKARQEAEAALARSQAEEDHLRHCLTELDSLGPRPGEEEELAEQRVRLMNREKLVAGAKAALGELVGESGAERRLHAAARQLQRLRDKAGPRFDAATGAVERAAVEAAEAIALLEAVARDIEFDSDGLDKIEERLFALRALARKHGVRVDALAAFRDEIARKLALLDDRSEEMKRLRRAESETRETYAAAALRLSERRYQAAEKLDAAVKRELAPLKLGSATFRTAIETRAESEWGEYGQDRIFFEVSTNPGAPPGPLARIASGGELARFMLALKTVLARSSTVPTLVFDEVDSGVGGAVADAVGDRLQRLSESVQILVVTHSPQVAARGAHHWRILKEQLLGRSLTRVEELSSAARREEIARMLSGSLITPEARAAAASLIEGARV
jgi:DNA repair protein RecN (Recombination protein N)